MNRNEYAQAVASKAIEVFSRKGEKAVEYAEDVLDSYKEEADVKADMVEKWTDIIAALKLFSTTPYGKLQKAA